MTLDANREIPAHRVCDDFWHGTSSRFGSASFSGMSELWRTASSTLAGRARDWRVDNTYYVALGDTQVLVHNTGGVWPNPQALADDALERAEDIHGALHPRAARARTTSVIHALKPDGTPVNVVSTSGKRNLTQAQKARMQDGEEAAPSS